MRKGLPAPEQVKEQKDYFATHMERKHGLRKQRLQLDTLSFEHEHLVRRGVALHRGG